MHSLVSTSEVKQVPVPLAFAVRSKAMATSLRNVSCWLLSEASLGKGGQLALDEPHELLDFSLRIGKVMDVPGHKDAC